ncbi:tripartite tricarboxylate transporter permease [Citricoccus muralis]|uniref:Tripartite tricarboxylate transporter permease n=1 Tax=Citricoccus muralis TaxID=169134 RepID=A0ABY8H789_9MICC|nr:tripartite tricarboxylate transporter permease [Citricoccus muralis]WFP17014.1 tripartite tricarboxylate transporter permease [Citricoccus muralis]
MVNNFSDALGMVADPFVILVVVLSGLLGIVIGSLPGLTSTLGAALLIPFTFFLDPIPAIASIITMSAMAIFAGDIPGALLRMPGTPSSAAYVSDLYEMTRQGKARTGLTISLLASVIGGLGGSIVLILLAPVVGEFALGFTSYEYFWVAVLGLTAAVIVSQGSQIKGTIALMTGLLISTVGLDVALGYPRFTFDQPALYQGIHFIPAMIGLFGISEVLRNVTEKKVSQPIGISMSKKSSEQGSFGAASRILWKRKGSLVQGNVTGSIVGAVPGAGADIASWISYAVGKNTSKKDPSEKGYNTGPLVAAGGANNAALGSSYIPTLAFGIPGDTITAILIGVLLVKGIEPGPNLFLTQTDTLYALYVIFILANLLLIPLGLMAIRTSGLILKLPRPVLMATIVALSVTGAYAINMSYLEIGVVVGLAVVGFFFERYGVPLAPVVLGIVLGPNLEANFMQSVIKTNWDLLQFFTRPVSAILIGLTALVLLFPLISKAIRALLPKKAKVDEDLPTSTSVGS